MGSRRRPLPSVRRFLLCMAVCAAVTGFLAREHGPQITEFLASSAATDRGWRVLGWAVGGPPLVMFALAWMDRGRFYADQLRFRATVYGLIFGLGGFVAPAFVSGSYDLYGDGIEVANPLAYGWLCGFAGNVVALAFSGAVDAMRARAGGGVARGVTMRFMEVAWLVLLVVSGVFAAYGAELGFVY